jgi:hypothetical protein
MAVAERGREPEPVGAENPVMSCDLDVLVDEAAEPVTSERPDDRSGGWRGAVVPPVGGR